MRPTRGWMLKTAARSAFIEAWDFSHWPKVKNISAADAVTDHGSFLPKPVGSLREYTERNWLLPNESRIIHPEAAEPNVECRYPASPLFRPTGQIPQACASNRMATRTPSHSTSPDKPGKRVGVCTIPGRSTRGRALLFTQMSSHKRWRNEHAPHWQIARNAGTSDTHHRQSWMCPVGEHKVSDAGAAKKTTREHFHLWRSGSFENSNK